MSNTELPLEFKFKWLDDEGNSTGFLSSKGHFDGEQLVLDKTEIPVSSLAHVENREKRISLGDEKANFLNFMLTRGNPDALVLLIGRSRAKLWAQRHREKLIDEGRGQEYREVICPHCEATLDLTGFPKSPQVSCEYCFSVCTLDADKTLTKQESTYRLCDECGMYSKPRRFTIFYFYFLVIVWGFWSSQTWRCPGCMRPTAWKMLFGNLLFLIGVPVAIAQLIRSYGGTELTSLHPQLDSANVKARAGKFKQAIDLYSGILTKRPYSAGVKYNIALALLQQENIEGASKSLEYAIDDCANYGPAAHVLAGCYEQLGEEQKLIGLKKQWGVDDAESIKEKATDQQPDR